MTIPDGLQKTAAYSADNAARLLVRGLSRVDSARQASWANRWRGEARDGLMLSEAVVSAASGGTWADLQPDCLSEQITYKSHFGLYLVTLVLSLMYFLLVFFGFLPDGAYPFARSFGFCCCLYRLNLGALVCGVVWLYYSNSIGQFSGDIESEAIIVLTAELEEYTFAEPIGLFCFILPLSALAKPDL